MSSIDDQSVDDRPADESTPIDDLDGDAAFEILVAAASHDVRNALSVISTGTSLINKRARLDPADQLTINRITRASDRIAGLVDTMALFSSLRRGGELILNRSPCDVVTSIDEVVRELAASGRKIERSGVASATALVDPLRFRHVLATTIGNAIDYSPASAAIRATVRRSASSIHVDIWNEGPAIQPALLERLFRPFPHGRDRTASRRSLGLGLFIARRLVMAHGGSMTAVSSDGQGTTMTIELPAL